MLFVNYYVQFQYILLISVIVIGVTDQSEKGIVTTVLIYSLLLINSIPVFIHLSFSKLPINSPPWSYSSFHSPVNVVDTLKLPFILLYKRFPLLRLFL